MSKVLEIHERLKKIDEAEYFPGACIDLAEKMIRRTASVEFQIIGTLELAWRRGFQAGIASKDLDSFSADVINKLVTVLEAVGVQKDMIFVDHDTVIEPVDMEVRHLARDLLDLVYALEQKIQEGSE